MKKRSPQNTRYLILLIVNTILALLIYRIPLSYAELTDKTFFAFVVMVSYLALLLGFVLAYLIYNRFLYRKGVTPEQLPTEWSAEQKVAFLADGERRLQRSKWMLTIIFPLLFTFLIDAVDLFFIDPFFRQ
ncbi:MAG: hypothetical protein J6B09_01795 [Clostridia bacterium]|nr:hypothetical protein [Clostridia bacterium]MBQ8717262.1 hypothetical protein [Clostridia bacterium]